MDGQDWTPVVVNKKRSTTQIQARSTNPDAAKLRKLENDDTFVKAKMFSQESLKTIISYRIEHKLSQSDFDGLCGFPRNTIQQFEAKKLSPSTKQLQILNKILKTGLSLAN